MESCFDLPNATESNGETEFMSLKCIYLQYYVECQIISHTVLCLNDKKYIPIMFTDQGMSTLTMLQKKPDKY